ncbi:MULTISPECIES: CfaE/CblD family pilus tip adhesin, partial [Pantoea]|uniref:CfaE/CblD family pilus tip adhesin n=1 Tax=Pantoea dispersa TaxID=59814 RepID=UPI0032155802
CFDYEVMISPLFRWPDLVFHFTAGEFNRRQIIIPDVSGYQWCVYAPITQKTPFFILADKAAGHYTGTLRVPYVPTTSG